MLSSFYKLTYSLYTVSPLLEPVPNTREATQYGIVTQITHSNWVVHMPFTCLTLTVCYFLSQSSSPRGKGEGEGRKGGEVGDVYYINARGRWNDIQVTRMLKKSQVIVALVVPFVVCFSLAASHELQVSEDEGVSHDMKTNTKINWY